MNQEIFSPDYLDQFQFSPSDKRTSTQPIAAYVSSLTESLKSLSIAKELVAAADNSADVDDNDDDENTRDDASDLETEPTVPKTSTTEKVAVPKTSKKRGPRGPYKKNPNNSFFTQLNYYIIISKLLYYYINY